MLHYLSVRQEAVPWEGEVPEGVAEGGHEGDLGRGGGGLLVLAARFEVEADVYLVLLPSEPMCSTST